jgi:hypothetical protein
VRFALGVEFAVREAEFELMPLVFEFEFDALDGKRFPGEIFVAFAGKVGFAFVAALVE